MLCRRAGLLDELILACDCSIIASERGHTQVVSTLLKQSANIKASTRYPMLAPYKVRVTSSAA